GMSTDNEVLMAWIARAGLGDAVRLVGERRDIPALLAACDVAALSSAFGEGCPNVVGEAMACGVPIVVTDVGDTREMVGRFGRVVPRREPEALAAALVEMLRLAPEERRALGAGARQRIVTDYGLEHIARRYAAVYE